MEVPEKGRIYRLRDVKIDPLDGDVVCTLREIGDQHCMAPGAEGFVVFALSRFRPLVTRSAEDDIAIFAPLLDQVLEPA